MNKFLILLLLALVVGGTVGWAVNHYRYGYREPRFGPITMDGSVTASNAMQILGEDLPDGFAQVELVGNESHDFGVMAPDEEGEHAFVLKNVGTKPLTLRVGATSCKCTLGSLEKDSLAPGEQTEVTLSWSIKTDETAFSQSAQIITNDPLKPAVDLKVTGRVVRDIELVPKEWSFGEIASGESIELSTRVYNYMSYDIEPTELKFSNDEMTELSEFQVDAYQPNEDDDDEHASARQAFLVKAKIEPGLKQGSVSQNFIFRFKKASENASATDDEETSYVVMGTTGRIIGALSMIPNPKLTGREGGGYIYTFGRLGKGDSLTGKAFVVVKGSERENVKLSVGEVTPEGVIEASLGEPMGRGTMTMYPLELTLVPGEEPIERLGKNAKDYGMVWIESDNPKVPKMRIGVKFGIPSKSRVQESP